MVGAIELGNPSVVGPSQTHLRDILSGVNFNQVYGVTRAGQNPTPPGNGLRGTNQVDGNNAAEQLNTGRRDTATEQFRSDLRALVQAHKPSLIDEDVRQAVDQHMQRYLEPTGCLPNSCSKTLNNNAAAVIVSLQQDDFIEPNSDTVMIHPQILEALQSLDGNFTGKLQLGFTLSKDDLLYGGVRVNSDNAKVTVTLEVENGNIKLGGPKVEGRAFQAHLSDEKNASETSLCKTVGPVNLYVKKADVYMEKDGSVAASVAGKGIKSALAINLLSVLGRNKQKMVSMPQQLEQPGTISVSQFYQGYIANAQKQQRETAGAAAAEGNPLSTTLNNTLLTMEFEGNLPADSVWGNATLMASIDGLDIIPNSVSISPEGLSTRFGLPENYPKIADLVNALVKKIGIEQVSIGWEIEQEPEVRIDIQRLEGGRIDCDNSRIAFEPPLNICRENITLQVSGIEFIEKGTGDQAKLFARFDVGYELSNTGFRNFDSLVNQFAGQVANSLFNFVASYAPVNMGNNVSAERISGEVSLIEGGVDMRLSVSDANGELAAGRSSADDGIVVMTLDGREEGSIQVKGFCQIAGSRFTTQEGG